MNFEYVLDTDTGHAQWAALPDSNRLPAALRTAAPFASHPRAPYPESADSAFMAAAPILPLAAPELIVQSAAIDHGQTHYRVRVRSVRDAPEMYLVFTAAEGVQYAELESARGPIRVRLWPWPNGATVLDLKTLHGASAELSFSMSAQPGARVRVLDLSFGLPVQGASLLAKRGAEATASQDGDVTLVTRNVALDVSTIP